MKHMIDRERLTASLALEQRRYLQKHERCKEAKEARSRVLLFNAPMNWMQQWPLAYPLTIVDAAEQQLTDADGNRYVDLCLGYSAAFPGHRPLSPKSAAVLTIPSDADVKAGEALRERFGQAFWGFALSATDANRFVIKLCREITGRKKILVFNGCYHGTVEETFAMGDGAKTVTREGNIGIGLETEKTTTAIEFNDISSLKNELEKQEYACLLFEPVMTNCGIIYPQPGYLAEMKKLCKANGTVTILDEAHTITADHRGYAKKHELAPDILVLGKCLGGGMPVGVYGVTEEVKERIDRIIRVEYSDTSGIGGTMTGSPAAMAAILDTLSSRLTEANYRAAISHTKAIADGIRTIIQKYTLSWSVATLGARFDLWFTPEPAKNAAGAFAVHDADLYEYVFLALLNRGFVLSPYWNILGSVSPFLTNEEIGGFLSAFEETIKPLMIGRPI